MKLENSSFKFFETSINQFWMKISLNSQINFWQERRSCLKFSQFYKLYKLWPQWQVIFCSMLEWNSKFHKNREKLLYDQNILKNKSINRIISGLMLNSDPFSLFFLSLARIYPFSISRIRSYNGKSLNSDLSDPF